MDDYKFQITRVSYFLPSEGVDGNDATTLKVILDGQIPAYLKVYPFKYKRRAVAELIASQLARFLGLPVPKPYLVTLKRDELPESIETSGYDEYFFTFACASVSHPQSYDQIVSGSSENISQLILRYEKNPSLLITFDQWILNTDRNTSNILYCPIEKKCHYIDHGQSLGCSDEHYLYFPPSPEASQNNMLLKKIYPALKNDEKHALKKKIVEIVEAWQHLPIDHAVENSMFASVDRDVQEGDISSFLNERIEIIKDQLCQQIGIPELSLIRPSKHTKH